MSDLVYHYTDPQGFVGIIEKRCVWLSNVFYLNDYAEHALFCEKIRDEVGARLEFNTTLSPNQRTNLGELKKIVAADSIYDYYCAAFSTKGDHLGQWCRYADDGRGFAIGFEKGKLPPNRGVRKILSTILRVRSVWYEPEKQAGKARKFVEQRLSKTPSDAGSPRQRTTLERRVGFDSLQCKDRHFKDENEVRILFLPGDGDLPSEVKGPKFRASGSRIVPYYEFHFPPDAVKEVVLGPQNDYALNEHSLRQFLHENGYDRNEIKLRRSEITYISS